MTERDVSMPEADRAAPAGDTNSAGPPDSDRVQALEGERRAAIWCYAAIGLLGVWLATSPFTFGYDDPAGAASRAAEVTQQRGLSPIADRITWVTLNEVISGCALVVLAGAALRARWLWAPWATCLVGLWISFAPLLLWAPSAAAYANETIVGALVIALTILVPNMPGMAVIMRPGPTVPPGWSYNPSSWWQRAPLIALGFLGYFFARYLASYQLGYIDWAHDWFFGNGSVEILDSDISRAWPVSDAGLGVFAYSIEALMGFMGGTDRWRTMPWMVTFFGILVIPLSAVSIFLIIMQPVSVGTWSTPALITAAAMLVMIPLTLDEVVAMAQFVRRRVRDGNAFWATFFKGGTVEGGGPDERSPHYPTRLAPAASAGVWGVSLPWSLVVSTAIGIGLMALPDVLGVQSPEADSTHLVGSLAVCVAVIATAEVGRLVRYAAVPLGIWSVLSTFVLGGSSTGLAIGTVGAGLALIALSWPRGPVHERYGTAQRYAR